MAPLRKPIFSMKSLLKKQFSGCSRDLGSMAALRKPFFSDFLPVGDELDEEVLERGYDSVSSEESDGAGLEYAFENQSDDGSEVSVGGAANTLDSVDFAV